MDAATLTFAYKIKRGRQCPLFCCGVYTQISLRLITPCRVQSMIERLMRLRLLSRWACSSSSVAISDASWLQIGQEGYFHQDQIMSNKKARVNSIIMINSTGILHLLNILNLP